MYILYVYVVIWIDLLKYWQFWVIFFDYLCSLETIDFNGLNTDRQNQLMNAY